VADATFGNDSDLEDQCLGIPDWLNDLKALPHRTFARLATTVEELRSTIEDRIAMEDQSPHNSDFGSIKVQRAPASVAGASSAPAAPALVKKTPTGPRTIKNDPPVSSFPFDVILLLDRSTISVTTVERRSGNVFETQERPNGRAALVARS
jgi:hypothetical protein